MHPPGHPAAGRAGRQAAAGAVVAAWIRTDLPARETRSTCRRARCGNRTLRTSRSHDKHDHKDRDPGTTGHTETRPHHAICARASFHLPSGTHNRREGWAVPTICPHHPVVPLGTSCRPPVSPITWDRVGPVRACAIAMMTPGGGGGQVRRASCGAGLACPCFLPGGAVEDPGSGPAAGRRVSDAQQS
jgi:hypothetical protein